MILTEYGLHFAKDGDRWRCVDWPDLVMLPNDPDEVDGQRFDTLAEAVRRAIRRFLSARLAVLGTRRSLCGRLIQDFATILVTWGAHTSFRVASIGLRTRTLAWPGAW